GPGVPGGSGYPALCQRQPGRQVGWFYRLQWQRSTARRPLQVRIADRLRGGFQVRPEPYVALEWFGLLLRLPGPAGTRCLPGANGGDRQDYQRAQIGNLWSRTGAGVAAAERAEHYPGAG